MKTIIALVLLACFCAPAAKADTFIGLNNPGAYPQRWTCAGETFSDDGTTVAGICELKVPGVGRYVQAARYQYATTWDASTGAVTLGALTCYSPAHMGIDHSGCLSIVFYLDTNVVVVIEGVPFWYVTASVNGAELLHTQTGSLVFLP